MITWSEQVVTAVLLDKFFQVHQPYSGEPLKICWGARERERERMRELKRPGKRERQ
jgi:hypothetical protein